MKSISQVIGKIIQNMTLLRQETCHGCEMETEVYKIEITIGPHKGELIEWNKGCKCSDIALAKESLKNHNKLKANKMKQIFNRHSLINQDLQQATFKSYQASNQSQEKAKR